MQATKGQLVIHAIHRHRDLIIIGDARMVATKIRERANKYQEAEKDIDKETLIQTARSKFGSTPNYLFHKGRRNNPEMTMFHEFERASGKDKKVLAHKIREWIAGTDKTPITV